MRKANAIAFGLHRRKTHGVAGDQRQAQARHRGRARVAKVRRFLGPLPADRLVTLRIGPGHTRATRVAIPARDLREMLK